MCSKLEVPYRTTWYKGSTHLGLLMKFKYKWASRQVIARAKCDTHYSTGSLPTPSLIAPHLRTQVSQKAIMQFTPGET